MERLPHGVFDIIGSYLVFAEDDSIFWDREAGRPCRDVSSVNKVFAAKFYDSILNQKRFTIGQAPIWRMLVNNIEYWECRLEHDEDLVDPSDEDFAEFDFWSQQISHFETWWHNNPNSRAELIAYQPPARIGIAL